MCGGGGEEWEGRMVSLTLVLLNANHSPLLFQRFETCSKLFGLHESLLTINES